MVTTASDPEGRPTVVDLVDLPTRVVPIGRLDADTTGALLLTNDGDLAHQLAHPKYEIDKVYVVQLWKQPSDGTLRKLAEGVNLEDGKTAPAEVKRIAGSTIELTIHEGRNRQVKRMFEAVGYRVKSLHRPRYGPLELGRLEPGEWRELKPSEVELLRATTRDARGPKRGRGRASSGPAATTRAPRPR